MCWEATTGVKIAGFGFGTLMCQPNQSLNTGCCYYKHNWSIDLSPWSMVVIVFPVFPTLTCEAVCCCLVDQGHPFGEVLMKGQLM